MRQVAALSRQWAESDWLFYRVRPYSLHIAFVVLKSFVEINGREKIGGTSGSVVDLTTCPFKE